jgi:magnesium-transporting ATPase (P-type)
MLNFLISVVVDIVIILISFFIFKVIISGPTRHRMYEKFMSSFAKFVIYIFIAAVVINAVIALIFYRTRYVAYINIVAPAVISILVGFIASTVPTRGAGDQKKET